MKPEFDLELYLVLDPDLCRETGMVETAVAAVKGGATIVQLRDKHAPTEDLIKVGKALKDALKPFGVPLIVNDNIEVALAIEAEGLHIGQDDIPAAVAREKLGSDKILGVSVETTQSMAAIDSKIVDYVGIGPVFATSTKPDHKPPVGMGGLEEIARMLDIPSVAIGGLKAQHVQAVFESGTNGIAVVSAICGQSDPYGASQELAQLINKARMKTV